MVSREAEKEAGTRGFEDRDRGKGSVLTDSRSYVASQKDSLSHDHDSGGEQTVNVWTEDFTGSCGCRHRHHDVHDDDDGRGLSCSFTFSLFASSSYAAAGGAKQQTVVYPLTRPSLSYLWNLRTGRI